jgi:FAD/FMN-containing dehydrogenase
LGLAHERLSAGLTGFEVMGQFALSLVDKHHPQLRVPFFKETPWCVLLENSDYESEAHARVGFEALMEAAMENGWVTDAVVAESLAQAKSLWQIRETIPLAQVDEGLNIKHDISVPVSLIPQFVAETDALLQSKIPGIRLVNFGHLGDGNLHYNVQAPPGADGPAFLRDHEDEVNTWVFDQVQAFNGSISASRPTNSHTTKTPPHWP